MAKAYPRLKPLTAERTEMFWSYVDKTPGQGPKGDCWEWKAFRWKSGYGGVTVHNKSFRAHRVAFYLTTGYDPGELNVCHECDNPPCCRPQHLFDGTDKENSEDMVRKGRQSRGAKHGETIKPNAARGDRNAARLYPEKWQRGDDHWSHRHPELMARGEKNGNAKHPDTVIQQIRADYRNGATQIDLGVKYDLHQGTVSDIVRYITYKHLACPVCLLAPCTCPLPRRRGRRLTGST